MACSSEQKEDVSPNLLDNTYTLKYPELREVDSLFLYFQTDAALKGYRTLINSKNDSVKRYAATRLSEIKHQYYFMYNHIEDVDTSLLIKDLSFYRWLRLDRSKLSMEGLERQLEEAQFLSDSIRMLVQLSIYNNEEHNREDEQYTISKSQAAYFKCKEIDSFSSLHFDAFVQCSTTLGYIRQNLLGACLFNKILNNEALTKTIDSRFLSELHLKRGSRLMMVEDYVDLAFEELDVAESKMKGPCNNSLVYLKVWKLYGYSICKDSEINNRQDSINKLIKQLYSFKTNCKNIFVNIERNIAQTQDVNHIDSKVLKLFLSAKKFEEENLFRNKTQLESILYMLSEGYENLNQFDLAFNAYYENKRKENNYNYSPQQLIDSDLDNNAFINLLRFAEIHFSKWKAEQTTEDLENAIALLKKVEELMTKGLLVFDETTLLRYFNYLSDTYSTLAYCYLDKAHLNDQDNFYIKLAIESLFKKKNMLLNKDLFFINNEYNKSHQVTQEKQGLTFKIEKAKKSGVTISEELAELLWESIELENRYKSNTQEDFIDALQLKQRKSIEELQQKLPINTSVLSYHFSKNDLFVAHITSEKTSLHQIINEVNSIEVKTQLYKSLCSDPNSNVEKFQTVANKLYNILIPKEVQLQLNQNLIIIPDGFLNTISFDALITEISYDNLDWKGLNYLILNHPINYTPSDQLLGTTGKSYDLNNLDIDVLSFSCNKSLDIVTAKTYLSELPFSVTEHDLFQSNEGFKPKIWECASTSEFLNVMQSNNGYVHLSTHGFADENKRNDLKLYFRKNDYELDSLFAYELTKTRMTPQIVFLAACDSGVGKNLDVEGKYDLKRILLLQGVQSVISSLWKVNDYAAYEFTKAMLNNNLKISKSKNELINSASQLTHPYYWAGYIH